LQAADQHGVRSPLAECGLSKNGVRALARHWDIEAWDKPATPCLSSRIAYGVSVTPERLHRIDLAERELRALKLGAVRVRLHENELARLEVPVDALPRLCADGVRESLVARFRELGFRYITLDLEGFRSGSFKQLVAIEDLTRFASQSLGAWVRETHHLSAAATVRFTHPPQKNPPPGGLTGDMPWARRRSLNNCIPF
jgi:uncharacterized protein